MTAQLVPGDTSDGMGIAVIALEHGATAQPLWAVFSTGTALDTRHFVAVYARRMSG